MRPQAVQIVGKGEATPYRFEVNPFIERCNDKQFPYA